MSVAKSFVLSAIQEWGHSEDKRIAAVQALLNEAGFVATATCFPVFGGIWPQPCSGPDADEASAWLQQLVDTMTRGKFEREVEHVEHMLADRRRARAAEPGA